MANKLFNSIIPPVPKTSDRQTLQFFLALKNALTEISKSATFTDEGFVTRSGTGATSSVEAIATNVASGANNLSYRTPAAPTSLQATGIFESIILEWEYAGPEVGNFEVWRSLNGNFGQTVLRGVSSINLFQDSVAPGTTHYYWVRGVSTGQVEGPFNDTEGTAGTTGIKISQDDLYESFVENFGTLAGTDILAGDLSDEILARANIDTVLTSSVAEATANLTTARSDLDGEIAARIAEITALTGTVTGVQTDVTTARSDLDGEIEARIAEITALTGTVTGVQTNVTTARSDLDGEIAARIAEITSLTGTVTGIQTDVTTNATDIAAETSTRTSQIASLNDSIALIQTDVTTNADDISAEATTRTNQIAALNSSVATIETDVTTNADAISAEVSARTSQIASVNTSIAAVQTNVDAVASDLAAEVSTLETSIANIGTDEAAVTSIVNARVDPLEGIVESSYTLRLDVNNKVAGFALVNSADAPATFEINADAFRIAPTFIDFGSGDYSGSLSNGGIRPISVGYFPVGTPNAYPGPVAIWNQTDQELVVGHMTRSLANPNLVYTEDASLIRFKVNISFTDSTPPIALDYSSLEADIYSPPSTLVTIYGITHGLRIPFTTAQRDSFDRIEVFALALTNSVAPFVVENGQVFIEDAFVRTAVIQDATITTAMIQNAAITSAKIQDAAITSAKIQNAAITSAMIQDAAITSAKIQDAAITSAMIQDAAITNAKIESLAASKITAANLAAISANLGAITAGSLTGPDGLFQIDLANNRLDVYDENGVLRVRLGFLG